MTLREIEDESEEKYGSITNEVGIRRGGAEYQNETIDKKAETRKEDVINQMKTILDSSKESNSLSVV
jgi:hypothetical protein